MTVFDVGGANGRPFIVMELLPGLWPSGWWTDRRRSGRLWSGSRAPRGRSTQVTGGAPSTGDVEPGNLLRDAADRVHAADFGVASAAALESLTMTGAILGTAGCLSPEQARPVGGPRRRATGAGCESAAALESLRGTGQQHEAYALYDLGASLAGLGDCTSAKKALDQSQKIQGHRSEIDAAKQASKGH